MSPLRRFATVVVAALVAWLCCAGPAWSQTATGKKYAVLVGVSEYRSSHFPALPFAKNDVAELARLLKQPGAGFTEVRVLAEGGKAAVRLQDETGNIAVMLQQAAEDGRIDELVERIREFNPATVEFEPFGDPRIVWVDARQRRLACRIGMKDGGSPDSEIGFDPFTQEPTEDVRPIIVRRDSQARVFRLPREDFHIGRAADRKAVVKVDPGMAPERVPHG